MYEQIYSLIAKWEKEYQGLMVLYNNTTRPLDFSVPTRAAKLRACIEELTDLVK